MDNFYDQLAPFYPLIYGDWKAAMTQQAAQLSSLIGEHWGTEVKSVLDVSCGIGTQTLGLASLGYEVTASDLSAKAIQVAQQEADQRGLNIPFAVCDMRVVDHYHHHNFDILISCDNSVPHLLTDEEILQALRAFRICIRPGGGCIISLRNYEQEPREQGVVKPYGVREAGSKRYLLFQVWDWDFEGAHYDLTFYFVEDDRQTGHVQTHVMRSRYYAISPDQLLKLMAVAGFVDLKRLDDVYFQPIIIGTNPSPNFPN